MHAHHALLAFLLVLAGEVASAQEKAVPPQLLQAVKDADPAVRVKAIMGLSRLGAEAVPVMVEALKDEEANVSSAAAYGLRLIKLEPAALRESLRPFLADKSASVRQGVAGALSKGGPEAIPLLLPLLQDEGFEVRRTTVQSLQSIVQKAPKAADDALPGLAKALKDEEPKVRLAVVQALPRFGPKAVVVILAALSDADPKVRAYAAAALSPFKLESSEVLEPLVKQLKAEPEVTVRQSLLRTLIKLGPDAVPVLMASLNDPEPAVRKSALSGLGHIGPEAKAALPAVKEMAVKSDHPDLRKTAVSALPQFGPEGEAAMLDLFKSMDSDIRMACLQVLGNQLLMKKKKPPVSAVPDLAAALTDKDEKVRGLAAYLLGEMGPTAKDALPALTKVRKDADPRVSEVMEKAIEKIEGK